MRFPEENRGARAATGAAGGAGGAPEVGARSQAEARVRSAAGEGLARAAEAAHRAGSWAEERGGAAARTADAAHQAEARLIRASSYVRHREAPGMRADLEREVERQPVRALLIAAGVGFLLGRLLR